MSFKEGFKRSVQPQIEKFLFKNKAIIIFGARQVGKTTLSKQIIKNLHNKLSYPNFYFWRNYNQSEIDLIEEKDGILHTYEIKWQNKKAKLPKQFNDSYPNNQFSIINYDNFLNLIKNKVKKFDPFYQKYSLKSIRNKGHFMLTR